MGDKASDWYVYVVMCSDASLYCGIAKDDVHRRVREHNHGKAGAKYTRSRRPVRTLAYWKFTGEDAKSKAAEAEHAFKALRKPQKINVLLENPHALPDWEDFTIYSPARTRLNGLRPNHRSG